MYYEINIAIADGKQHDGTISYRHLFATSRRSITNGNELARVHRELEEKFPEPEYNLSISHHPQVGYTVPKDTLKSPYYD